MKKKIYTVLIILIIITSCSPNKEIDIIYNSSSEYELEPMFLNEDENFISLINTLMEDINLPEEHKVNFLLVKQGDTSLKNQLVDEWEFSELNKYVYFLKYDFSQVHFYRYANFEGFTNTPNYEKALNWMYYYAENGDFQYQIDLGNTYYYGEITEIDGDLAYKYYQLAGETAENTSQIVESNLHLAICEENGVGVLQNKEKSYEFYKQYIFDGYRGSRYPYYALALREGELGNSENAFYLHRLASKIYYPKDNYDADNLDKINTYINNEFSYLIPDEIPENNWFSKDFLTQCIRRIYSLDSGYTNELVKIETQKLTDEEKIILSYNPYYKDKGTNNNTAYLIGDFNNDKKNDTIYISKPESNYTFCYNDKGVWIAPEDWNWIHTFKWNDIAFLSNTLTWDRNSSSNFNWSICRLDSNWNEHIVHFNQININPLIIMEDTPSNIVTIPKEALEQMILQSKDAINATLEGKIYIPYHEEAFDAGDIEIEFTNVIHSTFVADANGDGKNEFFVRYQNMFNNFAVQMYNKSGKSPIFLEEFLGKYEVDNNDSTNFDKPFIRQFSMIKYSQFWTYEYNEQVYLMTLASEDSRHIFKIYVNKDGETKTLKQILFFQNYDSIDISFSIENVQ